MVHKMWNLGRPSWWRAGRMGRSDSVQKVSVRMMMAVYVAAVAGGLLGLRSAAQQGAEHSPSPQCNSSVICPGEELTYEVTYMNVHLGQVRLKTSASTLENGQIRYHAVAYMDSYEGVPFVDLHAIDKTIMDSTFFSTGFVGYEKKDDQWKVEKSHYNLPAHQIVVEKYMQKTLRSEPMPPSRFDTLRLNDGFIQDGLSILYYARAMAHSHKDLTTETLVYGKMGRTILYMKDIKPAYEEIEALEGRRIQVLPFEGKAEFEGIFGLTGDFKGWFSADRAAVPIKAEMKVLVGSVKLELIKWKRDGWNPPSELEAKH